MVRSRTVWLVLMVGSFYRIVSCRGNCRGGSGAHQRARTGSPARTAHGCAPLAAHPHLALQASRRGPVAQGIEQQPSKLKVAGSNPAGVAKLLPAPNLDPGGIASIPMTGRPARTARPARRRISILVEHRRSLLELG